MATKKVPTRVVPGQTYGKARKQLEAQRAMSIAPSPGDIMAARAAAAPAPQQGPARPPVVPGSLGAFNRPTEAPNEPQTAGSMFGPGPGPREAGIPMAPRPQDNVLLELRSIYQQFPDDDLADMIDTYIREGF